MSEIIQLNIEVNKAELLKMCREKLDQILREADTEFVFWDTNELVKRTCMSFDTIQKTFFYHPQFPKFKIGGKWYYPSRKTRDFLEAWLLEQGGYNGKCGAVT